MRVLHVDTGREWRGGQTQLLHLASHGPGEVAVALPPDAPLREALERRGVTVLPVAFGAPIGWRALAAAVRAYRPTVIAAHTSHAHNHAALLGIVARVAGRCRIPLVVHRRLDFAPRRSSWLKYRLPDGYVAVSQAVARVLTEAGVDDRRVAVVLDAVDPAPLLSAPSRPAELRRSLGWPADSTVLLAVGALVEHKGHRVLIDAVARARSEVRVAICGEGPLRPALQARIDRLGLARRVRLLGRRDDVPALLRSVDALVHPSLEEGMGSAVAEVMIAGLPVIASRAGGLPEVVGAAGGLVPPGDPAALALAIEVLAADPGAALARAQAAAGPARQRHAIERMVTGTTEAYRAFAYLRGT